MVVRTPVPSPTTFCAMIARSPTTTSTSISRALGGNNRFFVRAVASDGLRRCLDSTRTRSTPTASRPSLMTRLSSLMMTPPGHTTGRPMLCPQTGPRPRTTTPRGAAAPPPIGYGAADLGTTLKPGTPKTRPLTTYARTTFTVADPTAIGGVNVSVTADDGAVATSTAPRLYASA